MWPKLQLTDFEKQFVSVYAVHDSGGNVLKPGVLRRSYRLQLASQAQREKNIPAQKLIDQIQISRRARIFAITFSGNTDCFRLKVANSNGTQYTNPANRSQQYPVVSSLVAGSYYNALALGGKVQPLAQAHASTATDAIGPNPGFVASHLAGLQAMPWIIEPNWITQPNETLIFQGWDITPAWSTTVDANGVTASVTPPSVLNIELFAWEFPGMGR